LVAICFDQAKSRGAYAALSGERGDAYAVRAGGRGLGGCRAGDGLLFRLRAFGSGARFADACAHRRRARRANIYGGSGSVVGTALAALLVGYLQQGLQMVGIPNQVSSALSGALLVVVVMGRSLSLHREWVRSLFKTIRSVR
jgi:predicted ABC-type sugar transport system permease subunit